jgi:putative protease
MAASLHPDPMDLVCAVATPAALRAAVDAGADGVRCGCGDATDAGAGPGPAVPPQDLAEAVRYAHRRGADVLVAIDGFAPAGALAVWYRAVDRAAAAGADALVLADMAVLDYAARTHPRLRRHLAAQAGPGTPEAVRFYAESWGVTRVALPRALTVEEISSFNREIGVETEVAVFDDACGPTEGRRRLAAFTADGEESRLVTEPAEPNVANRLAGLQAAGVTALGIDGRRRDEAAVARVVRAFRGAVDATARGKPPSEVARHLAALTAGSDANTGGDRKPWR